MSFEILDADGMRDAGEPGLQRLVQIVQGQAVAAEASSDQDGRYLIDNIAPGDYLASIEADDLIAFCGDPVFSFDPLLRTGCSPIILLPWHPTSPDSVPVTIASNTEQFIDFGLTPSDTSILTGVALLEDNFAQPGTIIEALVDGTECGKATIPENYGSFVGVHGAYPFELRVIGAGERQGCATPGQEVRFLVGGVLAQESYSYVSFGEALNVLQRLDLLAISKYSWYWLEQQAGSPLVNDASVQALVDGKLCGEATVATAQSQAIAGFPRLVLPSDVITPGCGQPGAKVSFVVGGVQAENTIDWRPGLQRITLQFPASTPPATPPIVPSLLPQTGSGPATLPSTSAESPSERSIGRWQPAWAEL